MEYELNECIGKPKELWKALESLGLPKKISSCEVSALKVSKTVQHDTNLVLGGIKDYYSNLAGKILKKFPKPANKFTVNDFFQHYEGIIQSHSFNLATVSENTAKFCRLIHFSSNHQFDDKLKSLKPVWFARGLAVSEKPTSERQK